MNTINGVKENSMLYVSFNQDNSFFSVGTERGFLIYQTYPYAEPYERKMGGGIGIVEMLYKSNFLALMGGGTIPKFSKNKVIIWDDHENKVISELKFGSTIMNIKLKKDFLFVVCQKRIYVFDFNTYETKDTIDTGDNRRELIAINNSPEFTIIGYPSVKGRNYISIKNYQTNKTFSFLAHDDSVSKISMNNKGTLIASSNENGTTIKIHSCIDGAFLQEFKRGHEKAKINYICFDNDTKYMAVSSSRGTIHIFSMGSTIKKLKEHKKKVEAEKKEKEKKEAENNEKEKEKEKDKKEKDEKEKDVKEKDEKEKEKDGKEKDEKEKDKKEKVKEQEKSENIIESINIKEKNENKIEERKEDKKEEKKEEIIEENKNKINLEDKDKENEKESKEDIINNKDSNALNNKEINKNNLIKNEEEEVLPENIKPFLGGIFGFQTEKSFAKVRIKSHDSICAFVKNNLLIIISSDNKYYIAEINIKKGGDCNIIYEDFIIKNRDGYEIL